MSLATAPQVSFAQEEVELRSKRDPNREKNRYVVSIANHLTTQGAKEMESIGGRVGGIWIGHSEVEGCPTMARTQYIVRRGGITPLETRSIPMKSDHRPSDGNNEYLSGKNIPEGVRGYTVYAGDDMANLSGDRHRGRGIVEATELKELDWELSQALDIQRHFFPEWENWFVGITAAPSKLSDWVTMVNRGMANAPSAVIEMIGENFLESGTLFRSYALDHIERNRQLILSTRSTNMGGMSIGWSATSRLYAHQLDQQLEDAERLAQPASNGGTDALVNEMRADRELRMREMAIRERELGIDTPIVVATPEPSAPMPALVDEYVAPIEVETVEAVTEPLTDNETQTVEREFTMQQDVTVQGKEGKIVGKPGGRITVEFADGSKVTLGKADID